MESVPKRPTTAEGWNEYSRNALPGYIGLTITEIGPGRATGRLDVQPHHLAPNGFLHAATVIAVADTLSGCGCSSNLPEAATGFTTIELKANFLGTARDGRIVATATMLHGGRSTQVWDAEVTNEATGRAIASFRCTQMLLYPRD